MLQPGVVRHTGCNSSPAVRRPVVRVAGKGTERPASSRLAIRVFAAAGGLISVIACGLAVPSGNLPAVEQRWVVTALSTSIGMEELINQAHASAPQRATAAHGYAATSSAGEPTDCLPSTVSASIAFENDQVVISDGRASLDCSLRDLCPTCSARRQSKPAFSLHQEQAIPLPNRDDLAVRSVSVTGGAVTVSLQHDLDFPLLRRGEIDIQVWSSGDRDTEPEKLSEFSLDRDFVGGTPVSYTHDFSQDPVTIVGAINFVVSIDAPADPGTTVDIDPSDTMQATIVVDDLAVSAAAVIIDKELEPEPHPITVDNDTVDAIVDRLTGGVAIAITFTNPFPIEVQGTFDLGEAVLLTDEQRSITVRPGTGAQPVTTTKEVTLTREQLRAFLERGIFSFGGRATTGGVVRLDTDKEIRVTISVDASFVTEPGE